jgi:hypothetical protein
VHDVVLLQVFPMKMHLDTNHFQGKTSVKTIKLLQPTYTSPVPDMSNSKWVHERSDAGV